MSDNNKQFRQKIIEALVILIFGLGALFFTNLLINLSNKIFNRKTIDNNSVVEVKKTPFEEKDTLKKIVIVSDYKNTSINGLPDKNFKKNISIVGSIDYGYLYIKADVEGKPLSSYDSIYLKLQNHHTNEQVGGKLAQDKSLETQKNEGSNFSDYFYNLSNVYYRQNNGNGYETISGDWLKMFNQNTDNRKSVVGFSSTLRSGNIEEISIFYKCSTDSNCSIIVGN